MARRKSNVGTVSTKKSEPIPNNSSLDLPDLSEQLVVEPNLDVDGVVYESSLLDSAALNICTPMFVDKGCQADMYHVYSTIASNTSVIIKYVRTNSSTCDAEIQTSIVTIDVPKVLKKQSVKCGTPHVETRSQKVGPDVERDKIQTNRHDICFKGFSSIKKNENLLELAGVSVNSFNFLLDSFENSEKWRVDKKNRLLIFLMKIKTGMTFRAIGVLFCLHRTTISDIFFSLLTTLCEATAGLVPWISKDVVQITMPECFREEFPDTRVVIDCTEFRMEIPAALDERVFTYSHYKHGFTLKALIGMAPCGLISFKSKLAGGRKSDSQITIESGLIELLEDGDEVLADKGFPAVEEKIDESGTKSFIVMPPFLERNKEFTKEETELTYKVAKVRIHVERIMQRLRTYRVLDKIPEHFFERVDDILHICCVLVNLQPPILSNNENKLENQTAKDL